MPIGLRFRDDQLSFAELNGIVQLAEQRGFDVVFVPEASGREVFTQLASFAACTSRIRLAPGIATIFTRTPTLLAQAAATLDQLSNGRAMLGLGSGHAPVLTAGHGVTFRRPLARMREYVTIIRAILAGSAVIPLAHETPVTAFHLETPARAGIPIYMAALGPKMCELAGEVADGVLLNWATPEYVETALSHLRVGAERAGRDPGAIDVACYVRVAAGAESDSLRDALALEVARYVDMPFYRAMFDQAGFGAYTSAVAAIYPEDRHRAARLVPDVMLEALTVMADAEAARRRVHQYQQMGVKLVVAAPVPAGPDRARSWRAAAEMVGAQSG